MFNSKKSGIVRHPYTALTLIGLAAVGAVSIGEKVRSICTGSTKCIGNMFAGMKKDYGQINQM